MVPFESLGTARIRIAYGRTFSRFDTIHERDRETDTQLASA